MGPTSGPILAICALLAVGSVVATVVLWNRVGRRRGVGTAARAVLLVSCQLSACVAVGALVNAAGGFYPTWHDVFGAPPKLQAGQTQAGALDAGLRQQIEANHQRGRSLVVQVRIQVVGLSSSQPASVYLPAAYFDPAYAQRRFPVVELVDGFPGSPTSWLHPMQLQGVLDAEIAAGRALPAIAVMPTQNFQGPYRDGECIDAVGGVQLERTLVQSVRSVVERDFRTAHGPAAWSVMGYSTGGYCAVNMTMRHPDLFGAAVSMGGYFHPYLDRTTGALFGHSTAFRLANDPVWRMTHLPAPPVSLLVITSSQDSLPQEQTRGFSKLVRRPTQLSVMRVRGAHIFSTFRQEEPVAFDWLSARMAFPLAPPLSLDGQLPRLLPVGAPPHHTARAARHLAAQRARR